LLIALDSCPPSLIEAGCADGTLPNFRRLRSEGRLGVVQSDAILFPGSIWPSFFAQSDVSHHGLYHFLQWDRDTRKFRTPGPRWIEAPAFWDGIARRGAPVITLDVPFAAASSRPEGVTEVLGWSTHESMWSSSRPPALLTELNRRHGRSSATREVPGPRDEAGLAADLAALIADVRRRTDIIVDLAFRFDWRLLIACFTETHHAGHWFWGERATDEPQGGLKRVIRAVDDALPRLRALSGPDDLFAVFSTHGMGPKYHTDRFVDALRDYFDRPGRRRLSSIADPVEVLRGLLPAGTRRTIARVMPKAGYNRLVVRHENASRDWSRSSIVINPLDRLFYVSVNAVGERDSRIRELAAEFEAMHTLDGRPAAEEVVLLREVSSGARIGDLPDLVVRMAALGLDDVLVTSTGTLLRGARRTWQDGDHLPEGFYLQTGAGIAPGSSGPDVAVQQLAAWLCPAGQIELAPELLSGLT